MGALKWGLKQHLCCRASVCHSAKYTLDVASRAPRDEGRSCRCRRFERLLRGGQSSEAGQLRFRRARFKTPNWVFCGPYRVLGRELSEFLSAYYLCAHVKANSPSFSQNSPSLLQNSMSYLFRNSTLETVSAHFLNLNTVVSKTITDFFLRAINSNYRYTTVLPEQVISITETDLWKISAEISHCRYRFCFEFELISITDTDLGLETN